MPVTTDDPVLQHEWRDDLLDELAELATLEHLGDIGDPGAPERVEAVEAEHPPAPRRRLRGAIAGIVVGALVVAMLLVTGKLSQPSRFSDRDATGEFLRAWERSRTGTFVVESEWKRVKPNGETLAAANVVAQAPPNRVVRQLGSLAGEVDGKTINCYTPPEGAFACGEGVPLNRSFDDGVREELSNLRDHFYATDPPIYRVRTDDHGCYELVQTRPFPNPTFGRLAQLCFDGATGALRYSERHLENIVETITAQTIRSPGPSDFDLTSG